MSDVKAELKQIGDKACVIFHDGEKQFCYEDWCTHLGGPLSEGTTADGKVTCPWHGSRFEIHTGALVKGPATRALKKVAPNALKS